MEAIEERIRQDAKEEARQEANKEVMTMVGSLLAAIQAGGCSMPVMNKTDAAMETGTKSISDEESEDYEEDETLVQSALRWMVNDQQQNIDYRDRDCVEIHGPYYYL